MLAQNKSLLVAYSGGVDSSFLLKLAFDLLEERAVAVTAVSPSLPAYEREQARQVARWIGARQVEIESHELENPEYGKIPRSAVFSARTRCIPCWSTMQQRTGSRP